MEQPEQTDSPMSMSTSTPTSTTSTTSAMDLHSSASTGTTGSVELTEDVVTQVINSSPASAHQDIWAGSQAINYSPSGNFTRLHMSTGGKLPGIAIFSRPITVRHEGYTPKVQRLGTITGPVSLIRSKQQCGLRNSFKWYAIHNYIIYL